MRISIGGSFLLLTFLALASAQAGIAYPDPAGGWAYTYAGGLDSFGNPGAVADNAGAGRNALDGLWTHDNGSDSWVIPSTGLA